jgi:hypothetical protein
MSFTQQTPRVFNTQNVEAIRPGQNGVYGLFREGVWIYVGKGDIRARLLAHLNGDNPPIVAERPTHWVDEVFANPAAMDEREIQLIRELTPRCNQRVG